jgi:hypothetical protein
MGQQQTRQVGVTVIERWEQTTDWQKDRKTNRRTDRMTGRQSSGMTERQTGKTPGRHTGRQEGRRGGGVEWWRGRGGVGGRSSAIELLYAPAPPPPTVWVLKPPSWALHLLGLFLANICVCTCRYADMHTQGIVRECTRRPLQGGLLYIKPPMHL